MRRIDQLAQALGDGSTTSRSLVEDALARIADPQGEGARVFIKVQAEQARAMADATDLLRRHGRAAGRYAGIPIALKDLFDVAGEPTPAGSIVLADAPEAKANAPVVARMLAAGFIPVGRVNMTEFAFSGLGINPHYGTPASPWDRGSRRIPGGSSSGTAVAVADGMAAAGLGTDTGGSCRIPAAFCGIVGYKPTARRIPITGVLPLAPSLDSVGPLAPSVACCAEIDAILAGNDPAAPKPSAWTGCGSRCRRTWSWKGWTTSSRRNSTAHCPPCRSPALASTGSASRILRNYPRSTPRAASRRPKAMLGTGRCWRPTAATTTRGSACGLPAVST